MEGQQNEFLILHNRNQKKNATNESIKLNLGTGSFLEARSDLSCWWQQCCACYLSCPADV